jgi:hypothetical protein
MTATAIHRNTSVILDANVLFSSGIARLLLLSARNGAFRARWTAEIEDEARRNLVLKNRFAALKAFEETVTIERRPHIEGAEHYVGLFPLTEKDDRHVAAAAKADGSLFIVTSNVRHFDKSESLENGFEIITPDNFGLMLLDNNELAVLAGIDRTPPERFGAYMAFIKTNLPATYARIAAVLRQEGYVMP